MYIWRNICPSWETIFYLLFLITEKLYQRPSGMSARSLPVVCSRGGLDSREQFANFFTPLDQYAYSPYRSQYIPYDTEKKNLLKTQKFP